jgi:putative methyltransferase (TIGR04325 family)
MFSQFFQPIFHRLWRSNPVARRRTPLSPSNGVSGYEDPQISDLVVQKTAALLSAERVEDLVTGEALLPTLLAVATANGSRVLDFGGAAGLHYFTASRAFPDRRLRWAVVEIPAMVERAKRFENPNLRFFSAPEAARDWLEGVDLLHSNGALQCLDQPEAMLARLLECQPKSILWARLPLADKRTVQTQIAPLAAHGPGPAPAGFADRLVRHKMSSLDRKAFFEAHAAYRLTWRAADAFLFAQRVRS